MKPFSDRAMRGIALLALVVGFQDLGWGIAALATRRPLAVFIGCVIGFVLCLVVAAVWFAWSYEDGR